MHAVDEIGIGRLEAKMEVIAHDHIGMQPPLEAIARFKQSLGERFGCSISGKQILPEIPPVDHVVARPFELNSDGPRHELRLIQRIAAFNTLILGLTPSLLLKSGLSIHNVLVVE